MADKEPEAFSSGYKTFNSITRLLVRRIPMIDLAYSVVEELAKSREDLSEKVDRVAQSLREASDIVSELESGLSERMRKIKHLQEEYEKLSKLAQVEEDKAAAFIKQVQQTLSQGRGNERLISFGINILSGIIMFVFGIIFGPPLTNLLGITRSVTP
jgi:hypothetical protein